MKAFFNRLKEAFKYEYVYDNEPFPIQIIVGTFTGFYMLFLLAFMLILVATVPLWIIPYMIYWIKKEKKDDRT
jgi:hypothetical protein